MNANLPIMTVISRMLEENVGVAPQTNPASECVTIPISDNAVHRFTYQSLSVTFLNDPQHACINMTLEWRSARPYNATSLRAVVILAQDARNGLAENGENLQFCVL